MRLYETTIITDSQLEESETENQIKQVQDLISRGGGEMIETQRWGNRRFAYEVKGKRQGVYTHFLYLGETAIPASLEDAFKVNEQIIRFLTVVSEVDLKAKRAELAEKAPREEPEAPRKETPDAEETSEEIQEDLEK